MFCPLCHEETPLTRKDIWANRSTWCPRCDRAVHGSLWIKYNKSLIAPYIVVRSGITSTDPLELESWLNEKYAQGFRLITVVGEFFIFERFTLGSLAPSKH